ncbi:MAG: circadian clock protein KaiC, partial [Gammaproteobacteria bacterium]|nr:circadian clock protein KaiC [Gammaproteobacteria bacterium]
MTDIVSKAKTGIDGLDDVLAGGFSVGRVFLLEGEPGAGKTTAGLQFLLAGVAAGERGLYVTLSETEGELRAGAASHHWTLGPQIKICEVIPPDSLMESENHQSLLYPSDLELGETTTKIFELVAQEKPSRLVLDSLSEIRL